MLSLNTFDTNPTSVGPPEHPRSPASAKRANMAVPPFLMAALPLLNVPGHIIPTEKPVTAQPASDTNGFCTDTMQRYDAAHRRPLKAMNPSKLKDLLFLPKNALEVPIRAANIIGPSTSPKAFVIPRAFSANADAHWLTDCSLAPAHIIISIRIRNSLMEKSFFKERPVSPSLIGDGTGMKMNIIPISMGKNAQRIASCLQFAIPKTKKNKVEKSTTPT